MILFEVESQTNQHSLKAKTNKPSKAHYRSLLYCSSNGALSSTTYLNLSKSGLDKTPTWPNISKDQVEVRKEKLRSSNPKELKVFEYYK